MGFQPSLRAAGGGRVSETSNGEARLATLGLWAVPGIGPKALESIRALFDGDLGAVLRAPIGDWSRAVKLSATARQCLSSLVSLEELGQRLAAKAEREAVGIAFPGDAAFPGNLIGLADAPPLLFYRGTPSSPRRRIAMVGSRHPDQGFLPFARSFACEVAKAGVGVVSGAAQGVDRACHWGALDAGAETWAFLGSALDELDPAQAKLLPYFLERGGMFYSELPLGVPASASTFPRRNRLISGAADAVLVLRAGETSGALYTAKAAADQGRPLLAFPGESRNNAAYGCNLLIRSGRARLCLCASDVWLAVGLNPKLAVKPSPAGMPWDLKALSPGAQRAYQLLDRQPRSFEELHAGCEMSSAALISALCELELTGLVIQYPGKQYERV
jgi:DNA processing protein